MLDVLRHAGNKSLHAKNVDDDVMTLVLDASDESVGALLFETVNQLVDALLTKPRRADELFKKLPKDVQDSINRRASNPPAK